MKGVPGEVILGIEDNRDDVILIQAAFRHLEPQYRLLILPDATKGIEYLLGQGQYRDRSQFPTPRMVFLDLNLPGMDGFQFLEWLRKEPAVSRLPVVVLAGSHYPPDISRAYRLGADAFVTKPNDPRELLEELQLVLAYWAPVGRSARGATVGERASGL